MPRTKPPLKLLIIEDNPGDAVLFQAFFKQDRRRSEFFHVSDGEEALQFLYKEGAHTGSPRPDIIVVDINLPRIDGKDLVREIKNNDSLRSIPVIVFTSSESEEDIRQCYASGANCVLIKAADVDGASHIFELMESFWINAVHLPTSSDPVADLPRDVLIRSSIGPADSARHGC